MELKRNILDIKGIKVGQAENPTAKTGVSVVLAETGAICGVDVRGACRCAFGRLCLWSGGSKRCHELARKKGHRL